MRTLEILGERKKSIRIYLITVALIMCCLLFLRSDQRILEASLNNENSSEEAATVFNYSPRFSLPKGTYEFQISGDGGTGEVSVLSVGGPVYRTSRVDGSSVVMKVELDQDVSSLMIRSSSEDPATVPSFSRVRILSDTPFFADGNLLAFLVFLGLLGIGYIKYIRRDEDQTDAILYVIVTGAAIVATYPLFHNYLQYGHDLNFHLWRIEGIKDGLLSGQFPVRIHPPHNNGYGYITASMYPELFLYLPAVLRLLGVSAITAYKTFLFAMNLATAWIMYHSTRQMSKSKGAAGLASVIYTLSTWRIINTYHRAAIGEALGMTFFPLVVLGIYYILRGDKSKWYVLAIACTCVFQSHMISTLLVAILLIVILLIFIRDLFREQRFWALCKAGVLTVLLNLWFLVPFVYHYFSLDMVIHHRMSDVGFYNGVVIPAQLFNVFNRQFGNSRWLSDGMQGEMSLSLGVGVSLCLVAGLLYYLFKREKASRLKMGGVVFAAGVALTLMSTSLFPWQTLQQNELVKQFANTVQFPWRLLSLASPLLCMTGATVIAKWSRRKGQAVVFAGVCILCVLAFVGFGEAFSYNYGMDMRKGYSLPTGGYVGWDNEYFLTTTDTHSFEPERYQTSDPAVQVTKHEKQGTNIALTISGAMDGAYVEVPLLYYPGYEARDGENQKLAVVPGNNDVVRVMINADTAIVRVSYVELPIFQIATLISALTLLIAVWRFCRRKKFFARMKSTFGKEGSHQAIGKAACFLGVFLLIAVLLEIFVFNFSSIVSASYEELDILDKITVSDSLQPVGDGTYVGRGQDAVLELSDVNMPIKNLHLKLETSIKRPVFVMISASDAANAQMLTVPTRDLWPEEPRTEYFPLHFSGDVKDFRIKFYVNDNETVRIVDCMINAHKPILFSFGRVMLVWFLLMSLFLLRPKSRLHRYRVNLNLRWQRVVLVAMLVVQIVAFWRLVNVNPYWHSPNGSYYYQYHRLTEAFLGGHTYLEEEPVQSLKNMENPYDYAERVRVTSEAGEYFLWDQAYYNGKYYVYFGVVPVLFFYLPYYVITGSHLPTYIAIFITSVALVFAVWYLLYQIITRWFRNAPFTLYLILSILFVNSCGAVYILKRPDFYSLPILMAVAFAVWGVGLWLSAMEKDKEGKPRLNPRHLALGSTCIALISGCRPHLLVAMGLGVILFWRSVFHERTLFSKSSVKATLAMCAPFAIIAAGIMAYNYVRFDSVFDFGANYNLTTNDMRHRGFVWDRTFLGLFSYLFQPAKIEATFPFIRMFFVETSYLGITITEGMFGGVIFNNPFLWLSVFVVAFRKQIASPQARAIALVSLFFAVLLAMLDTQMAGILPRYQSDFTWLLLLSASIGALALYGSWKNEQVRHVILWGLLGCMVFCFAYHGIEIVVDISNSVQENNPGFYYHLQRLVAFWM